MTELWQLDATGQLALLRRGKVSSVELVQAHLQRMDCVNPSLNAIVTRLDESALAAAAAADAQTTGGPLRGLPFTVKEDIDCLGSPTTRGVPALRNALPYADAPVVARLKAAGAIPIGRTNLSEMGLRLCTVNPLHGRTLNPWDRQKTPGGSSGGDAAAVASGMTPMGLGGDLGGSLRVPAACCGCVTLKPTVGRIAHASSLPPRDYGLAEQLMLAVGPMVRSVADLRLLLPILCGRDIRDPRSVDAPLQGPTPAERSVAVVTTLAGAAVPASSVAAVWQAAERLQAAGWTVEEAAPPELPRVVELFGQLLSAEIKPLAQQLRPLISEELFDYLQRLTARNFGPRLSPSTLHSERSRLMREWSQFFHAYPVLLGPTLATEIWHVDADMHSTSGIELVADATRFVTPANVLGLPSLAVPMEPADGMPTSVLLQADLWREDLCLDAAQALESKLSPRFPN